MKSSLNSSTTTGNRAIYNKRLHYALILGFITIGYNLVEGGVSTFFGATDETLALFGFGLDSFVEVLSGIGIVHMIYRMRRNPVNERDGFEVTALKITGTAFYILTTGLVVGAVLSVIYDSEPDTTLVGIIIAVLSIVTMFFLYREKIKVGKELDSQPIISDANCTKTCFYLSFILLISSGLYELWQIPYVDALGSLGIAWYAWKEGKEAFEDAKSKSLSCSSNDC